MNRTHPAQAFNASRLIAALAAGATTFTLFSGVVSLSEPHRSQLMALNQKHHAARLAKATQTTHAATTVAVAERGVVPSEALASR